MRKPVNDIAFNCGVRAVNLRSTRTNPALLLSLFVGIALIVSAGAAARERNIKLKPGTGLAFGEFDLSESEVSIDAVFIVRTKPPKIYFFGFGKKPWESGTIVYTNGEFFSPNLMPGTYVVTGFRSGGVYFNLKDAYQYNSFEVAPGKVAYAGSYKLRVEKERFLRRAKGDFERADNVAAESRLLGWLAVELAGTDWAAAVHTRLSAKP